MTKKTPIKIIKREERNRQEKAGEQGKTKRESAQETARDMVGTVTNWVTEFQKRRREETTTALRILSKTPSGSQA